MLSKLTFATRNTTHTCREREGERQCEKEGERVVAKAYLKASKGGNKFVGFVQPLMLTAHVGDNVCLPSELTKTKEVEEKVVGGGGRKGDRAEDGAASASP